LSPLERGSWITAALLNMWKPKWAMWISPNPRSGGRGRGLKEDKNLAMVEELAKAIGADICGSRAASDAGWLGHDRQVGTSGKTVKPKLYMAVGHLRCLPAPGRHEGAKTIVAINKDPDAPIFNVADYGIVDDLFKVVPS
jgi:electron transfer flavoprotein alpha subunit